MDIVLDGEVVSQETINQIMKFYSLASTVEAEEKVRNDRIIELEHIITQNQQDEVTDALKIELKDLKVLNSALKKEREAAKQVYEAILTRGQSKINFARIEADYSRPGNPVQITNIIHRPNHGFGHAARAAEAITAIQQYYCNHNVEEYVENLVASVLSPKDLERLQLMMLFSVVGRLDETGFNDTHPDHLQGRKVYQLFRKQSAEAYLNYCQAQENRRGESLQTLYQEALLMEVMGYTNLQQVVLRGPVPGIFIQYVMEEEKKRTSQPISQDTALRLIQGLLQPGERKYTLLPQPNSFSLFPNFAAVSHGNHLLNRINEAHGLDLCRCYLLFPLKKNEASSVKSYTSFLNKIDFFNKPTMAKLSSFYQLMRHQFDALALTGQKSTFGLLSAEEFAVKKRVFWGSGQKNSRNICFSDN